MIAGLLTLFLLASQAAPAAPALSEVQRLKFQTIAQRIEIAQLKAQAAQAEFEKARADLAKLVDESKVDGYTLDLTTLTYVKKEPKQ